MHSYFLALLPNTQEREQTAGAAARLQTLLSLRGSCTPAENLHLTLHFLGRYEAPNPELETLIVTTCGWIHAEGFVLSLDRATSFTVRGGPAPYVFEPFFMPDTLRTLADQVQGASGIPRDRDFRPHVTWLRSRDRIAVPPTIDPILWRCNAFSLLHRIPDGNYRLVRTWALT